MLLIPDRITIHWYIQMETDGTSKIELRLATCREERHDSWSQSRGFGLWSISVHFASGAASERPGPPVNDEHVWEWAQKERSGPLGGKLCDSGGKGGREGRQPVVKWRCDVLSSLQMASFHQVGYEKSHGNSYLFLPPNQWGGKYVVKFCILKVDASYLRGSVHLGPYL